MRYFYDCEFLEDGHTIALISIGIVAEDGRELYLVNSGAPWARIEVHRWLMQNVVPYLPVVLDPKLGVCPDLDAPEVCSRREIQRRVGEFLGAGAGPIELWGYFAAYDHICLAQLWGPMVDLPPGIPMWTNDIMQEARRLNVNQLPVQQGAAHRAIDDARWHKQMWDYLQDGDEPVRGISHDRIYPRCVWCNGENWAMAVMAYSRGEIPCAAVAGCGRYLPEEYRKLSDPTGRN